MKVLVSLGLGCNVVGNKFLIIHDCDRPKVMVKTSVLSIYNVYVCVRAVGNPHIDTPTYLHIMYTSNHNQAPTSSFPVFIEKWVIGNHDPSKYVNLLYLQSVGNIQWGTYLYFRPTYLLIIVLQTTSYNLRRVWWFRMVQNTKQAVKLIMKYNLWNKNRDKIRLAPNSAAAAHILRPRRDAKH